MNSLAEIEDILSVLVGCPTVSSSSNLDLIEWVRDFLRRLGVDAQLTYDRDKRKANLFATVGPDRDGGVVLSGHSDVVPAEPDLWTRSPFSLSRDGERLYGRGSCDMKGFLACALATVPRAAERNLTRPLHLALTFDEEVGSLGAPLLLEDLRARQLSPALAIVGEPTGMEIIGGHKGGYELTTTIIGASGHASTPTRGVNAIEYATRLIAELHRLSGALADAAPEDSPFEPPTTTVNIGTIAGGDARNIIADRCEFQWEIREVPGQPGDLLLARLAEYAGDVLLPEMRIVAPGADIVTTIDAYYPGLAPERESAASRFIHDIHSTGPSGFVAFGSDAGHFQKFGMSTVVFGPGSIEQAHRPDEYIEARELARCQGFLNALTERLGA